MEPRRTIALLVGMAMMALCLGGCAGTGAPLTKQLGMDRLEGLWSGSKTESYVNDGAYLRESPSRSSRALTLLGRNTRVLELESSQEGWTRVQVAETGQTGWIATLLLSPNPVAAPKAADSAAKAPERTRATQEEAPVREESPALPKEPKEGPETVVTKPAEAGSEAPQAGSASSPSGGGRDGLLPSVVTPAEAAPPPPSAPAPKPKPTGRQGQPEMFEPF